MFLNDLLNDRQSAALEHKAQRLLRAVERARSQFLAKSRSSNVDVASGSYLDRLPLELIITIFGHTGWRDVVNLRKVCCSFKDLVDMHEHVIVSTILKSYEDPNISLLSRLFPPPKAGLPSQDRARRFTLKYLHSLGKRHKTCNELACYLARQAVTPLFSRQSISTAGLSRRDRKEMEQRKEQGINIIQERLVKQLYYVEHFLANTRLRLSATLTSLAAENTAAPDGPPTAELLTQIYREVQTTIIQRWSDSVLISTHHAFHFLINTIRLGLSPDPPHNTNDDTISVILRCTYPLQRIREFFAADTPSAPSRLRRQFMMDMQEEKKKAELLANVLFGESRKAGKRRATLYRDSRDSWAPRIGEVWFEAARNELRSRGLEKHRPDGLFLFPEVQGNVMVGCPDCMLT